MQGVFTVLFTKDFKLIGATECEDVVEEEMHENPDYLYFEVEASTWEEAVKKVYLKLWLEDRRNKYLKRLAKQSEVYLLFWLSGFAGLVSNLVWILSFCSISLGFDFRMSCLAAHKEAIFERRYGYEPRHKSWKIM